MIVNNLKPGLTLLTNVAPSSEIIFIHNMIHHQPNHDILVVVESEQKLQQLQRALSYVVIDRGILVIPAWDCLPYDRVSPRHDIQAQRMAVLSQLARQDRAHVIVLTTVSGVLQKVRPRSSAINSEITCRVGQKIDSHHLQDQLIQFGFKRTTTVYEQGEFAVRGGLIDLFPTQQPEPLRLDLFDDEIESLKFFDPTTQRSSGQCDHFTLTPCQEVSLTENNIEQFRQSYRQEFSKYTQYDPLYLAVSQGHGHKGIEHWLGYFYPKLDCILDYLRNPIVMLMPNFTEGAMQHATHIADYYQARLDYLHSKKASEDPYLPSMPDKLYLSLAEFEKITVPFPVFSFSRFGEQSVNYQSKAILNTAYKDINSYKAIFENYLKHNMNVHIACARPSGVEQLTNLLRAQNFHKFEVVTSWQQGQQSSQKLIKIHQFDAISSFEYENMVLICEHDLLQTGPRKVSKKSRRADLILFESNALEPGSYVVHDEHGIAQFMSLKTMIVDRIAHDCLELHFDGGDKLFLPIESLDLITRYGGEEGQVKLDKLGSIAWQARKARVKKRLEDIAHKLLEIAAARQLQKGHIFHCDAQSYDQFVDTFPHVETDDQLQAISNVIDDLSSGMPMDRLICGDVGFGKTEIALRAAFIVASQGQQVAIMTPTTLLCRQHFKNFQQRFKEWPLRVAQLSRFVTPQQAKIVKQQLQSGEIDIVIGTHALLGNSIQFKNLGLVVVDEEQHFGVKQKERLKHLAHNAHLLTLTATPIPRTLQMSLNGVRDLSIIATPPIDRLAVRTFITSFDPVVVKEAIQRERFRGGQIYYVCPHIKDLDTVYDQLLKILPDLKIAVAHGQMTPTTLEDIMDQFTEGKFDLLLSTNIIESGIDLSSVNTLFIHKADLFGLSQLYQLRGRVGRSNARAYAYLLMQDKVVLTTQAQRRLEVMQSLDSLGAGFQLANHDMDIRGAGNLLGQEQSGHVREVGVELYQQMLGDTIDALRHSQAKVDKPKWVPDITINTAVLIPENYIKDLSLRMEFYRRFSAIESHAEKEDLIDEMIDRFGKYPDEVDNLIQIIGLKLLCRQANVSKLDIGSKGITVSFYQGQVTYLDQLIAYVSKQVGLMKLRPDQKLVSLKPAATIAQQFQHATTLLNQLIDLSHV